MIYTYNKVIVLSYVKNISLMDWELLPSLFEIINKNGKSYLIIVYFVTNKMCYLKSTLLWRLDHVLRYG